MKHRTWLQHDDLEGREGTLRLFKWVSQVRYSMNKIKYFDVWNELINMSLKAFFVFHFTWKSFHFHSIVQWTTDQMSVRAKEAFSPHSSHLNLFTWWMSDQQNADTWNICMMDDLYLALAWPERSIYNWIHLKIYLNQHI